MKGKVFVIAITCMMAFPVLAAGPAHQQSRQNTGPSWHWDPDVVGERNMNRNRNQTANQYEEKNMAKDTDQNRFRENNADKAQFQSQENEPNGLGW